MGSEDVVKKILTQRPDVTRSQIKAMIAKKQEISGDLLSSEGAAHLVAEDLLVEINESRSNGLLIADLIPKLGDVTLVARVIAVWQKQKFRRRDNSEGTFIRILLGDEAGTISCMVWSQNAIETLESINVDGGIVRISHGYTRDGISGGVELHIGNRGSIALLSDDDGGDACPPIEAFIMNVNQITDQTRIVNVQGIIKYTPTISSFNNQGNTGTVLKTTLEDSAGIISIVAWNDKADELRLTNVGDKVRIINGLIRNNSEEKPELHIEKRSLIRILDRSSVLSATIKSINEKSLFQRINVICRVLSTESIREVQTKFGEKVNVSSILIGDKTGIMQVTLWRSSSKLVERMGEGCIVLFENAQISERLGQLSLNVDESTRVHFDLSSPNIQDPGYPPVTSINKLSGKLAIVEGNIIEEPSQKEVGLKDGTRIPLASFRIKDENGSARVCFWRAMANNVISLKVGDKIRLIGVIVKQGFIDKWELHSSALTKLESIEMNKKEKNVDQQTALRSYQ